MVTGATDGIGLGMYSACELFTGYAKRLAARGIHVILVSRSQERLDAVAEEIREMYHVSATVVSSLKVNTCTVAFDMNGSLEEMKATLRPVIETHPIGILVIPPFQCHG